MIFVLYIIAFCETIIQVFLTVTQTKLIPSGAKKTKLKYYQHFRCSAYLIPARHLSTPKINGTFVVSPASLQTQEIPKSRARANELEMARFERQSQSAAEKEECLPQLLERERKVLPRVFKDTRSRSPVNYTGPQQQQLVLSSSREGIVIRLSGN